MSIIQRRYDGILLFEGCDINPNGDPDADGMPRQDPISGHGITTGSMITRRVRDCAHAVHNQMIYLHRSTNIEKSILTAAEVASVKVGAKLSDEDKRAVTKAFCERYWDGRMCGGVLNVGSAKANNVNAVVTVGMGRSVHPIQIQQHAITRVCETSDKQGKDQEMGAKSYAAYGAYLQPFFVNPFHAEANGATTEDLAIYLDSLVRMFDFRRSGMSGQINMRGIWLFKHADALGCAPAHTLLERVEAHCAEPDTARSWKDYELRFRAQDLPAGIEVFTMDHLLGGVQEIVKFLD